MSDGPRKTKIAVTGAAGQLGTVVLRRLALDRSIAEIVAIDLRPPVVAIKKVRSVIADVRDAGIARHFEGCDVVVHLAFIVTQQAPREVFEAVNVGGSVNVFEAAKTAGATQIVYSSSVAQYGVVPGHPRPIVEETPRRYQKDFAYSATKFEVEEHLDRFQAENPSIAVARFRPGILMGARMDHALGRAIDGRVLPDLGMPPLPIVWDEDVADAIAIAIKQRANGAWNVVADGSLPVEGIARVAGFRRLVLPRAAARVAAWLAPVLGKLGAASADPKWFDTAGVELVVSSEKAKRELGWRPKYPTAADVAKRLGQVARGREDPRVFLFMKMLAAFTKNAPPADGSEHMHAHVHLELMGRGGADYSILMDGGKLRVSRGVPRPPTSVLSIATSTFLELLAGKASTATAQIAGKMRVEGDPMSGMVLGGIVGAFRRATDAPGARGWPARRLSAWMS